jgi:hypothetical protein
MILGLLLAIIGLTNIFSHHGGFRRPVSSSRKVLDSLIGGDESLHTETASENEFFWGASIEKTLEWGNRLPEKALLECQDVPGAPCVGSNAR